MTDREISWGRCRYCGKFYRHLTEPACAACFAGMNEHERRNDPLHYEPRYKVVEDPLPPEDGGFSVGAGFSTNDHKSNLRWSAYTPGTVLNDTKNNVTLKIYNKDNGQRAIRQVQT